MVWRIVLNVVRGFSMGAADLVPGVSGGTIALLLGIYERLIASVRAGSRALGRLLRLDPAGFRRWLLEVEWSLVLPLGVGILAAILALARIIQQLLADAPELMAAIFMGLVAGSVVVAARLIRRPAPLHLGIGIVATIVTFVLLGITNGTSEDSVAQAADPALWTFFVAGAIAICAMILPGISGSFLLVVMGMYAPLLSAVTERDLVTLVVFAAGAVVGLALFSQVLHVALQRYHDIVLALLIGLMAGSVRVLWPWPDGVDSTVLALPEGEVLLALVAAVLAFALVVMVGRFAQRLDAPAPDVATASEPARLEATESAAEG